MKESVIEKAKDIKNSIQTNTIHLPTLPEDKSPTEYVIIALK